MAFWVGHFKRKETHSILTGWRLKRDLAIRENMMRLRLMLENTEIIDSVTVEIDPEMSDYLVLVRCAFDDKAVTFSYSVYEIEDDTLVYDAVDRIYKEIMDTITTEKEDGSRRE
jgi:hypothetical protein